MTRPDDARHPAVSASSDDARHDDSREPLTLAGDISEDRLHQLTAALSERPGSDAVSKLVEDVYPTLRALPPSPGVVDCLLDVATHYFASGYADRALDPCDEAESGARRLGDRRRLWRSLNAGGAMRNQTLDYPGALRKLTEALQIANELGDLECRTKTIGNIGVAHNNAGKCADSMEAFEAVVHATESISALARLREAALSNIAYQSLLMRDIPRGIAAVEAALSRAADSLTPVEAVARVNLEAVHSRLLIELRQFEKARERAREAKRVAVASGAPLAMSTALGAEGMAEIAAGATDIGLTRLKKMVENARHGPEAQLREALLVGARGYELAGQPDMALLLMHEVLSLSRERVREAMQRHLASPLIAAHAVHAAHLQAAVDQLLGEMVTLSINTGVRAGHDRLHSFRVRCLAELFARSEGWEDARAEGLGLAAQLCDVGMQVVPDELLHKSRGLSAGERKLVNEHTTFGAEILTRARLAVLQPCVTVAKFHHERWDGSGPHALIGDGIPEEARVTALVDALDAMLHDRPWRPALTMPAALRQISEKGGTAFDPRLAERFVAFVQREYWKADHWDARLAQNADDSVFLLARSQIARMIRNEE